jgi:hypothetical protein
MGSGAGTAVLKKGVDLYHNIIEIKCVVCLRGWLKAWPIHQTTYLHCHISIHTTLLQKSYVVLRRHQVDYIVNGVRIDRLLISDYTVYNDLDLHLRAGLAFPPWKILFRLCRLALAKTDSDKTG